MTCFDPQGSDRAADLACTYDPDLRGPGTRLRLSRRGGQERDGGRSCSECQNQATSEVFSARGVFHSKPSQRFKAPDHVTNLRQARDQTQSAWSHAADMKPNHFGEIG
jgi:hypothetical protein